MPKKQCMEGFKLFGVQIDVSAEDSYDNGYIRKSKSMGNLNIIDPEHVVDDSGYLSDELIHHSSKERKKGKPWTEEEHRSFLLGLQKLGKGNWKGIATNYVPTRDSSQVASHAQKYFIRMAANHNKKRRRASIFDINKFNEQNQSFQDVPGSSSDKSAEGAQNIGEPNNVQATIQAPVTASQLPPLPPMASQGIPYFYNVSYMPRATQHFAGGVTHQGAMPISWVPVINYAGQRTGFIPATVHGAFATTCTSSVPQPSAVTLVQGTSQAAAPVTNNDELNHNIQKPVSSFAGRRTGFMPTTVHGAFATTCATSVPQSSAVTLVQGTSQTAAPITNNEELNHNIQKLKL